MDFLRIHWSVETKQSNMTDVSTQK
jgi:hypothetical protein